MHIWRPSCMGASIAIEGHGMLIQLIPHISDANVTGTLLIGFATRPCLPSAVGNCRRLQIASKCQGPRCQRMTRRLTFVGMFETSSDDEPSVSVSTGSGGFL